LLAALDEEFTHTFGGCTVIRGLDGSYLSEAGVRMQDRINLIYTDVSVTFDKHFLKISLYAERVREAAFRALDEEAILIAVIKVYHCE
jgi:hypothetical protein